MTIRCTQYSIDGGPRRGKGRPTGHIQNLYHTQMTVLVLRVLWSEESMQTKWGHKRWGCFSPLRFLVYYKYQNVDF
jgi:hypothetical protein